MTYLDKVIKGMEILINGCNDIQCDNCCFYISIKPTRCGLREAEIHKDALTFLKQYRNIVKSVSMGGDNNVSD